MAAGHKRDIDALLERCKKVGWAVAMANSGHWRVDTGRGVFTVAATPTGNQAVRNALGDAKRYGLERLEVAVLEREERIRLAKIEADRAANDAKLAKVGNGAAVSNPFTVPDDEVDSDAKIAGHAPSKMIVAENADLGAIDGVAIVVIAPAMIKTPIMPKPGPIRNGEELLLADGRVLYRCTMVGGSWRLEPDKDSEDRG